MHTGVQAEFPPAPPFLNRWQDRQPVAGSTIKPGEEWGVTFGVELMARRGRADALRIVYQDDRGEHVVRYRTSIRIRPRC